MTNIRRLAMWSGPRNISTALLRAWENRPDTVVVDEPLYAFYLERTGKDHPGRDEILAVCPSDPAVVVDALLGPLPDGATVFYQKHMAHHVLPEMDRAFLDQLENGFLLREPAAMLLSLSKVTPHPQLEDTGLPQQLEIFRQVSERSGNTPPVLDSRAVLQDPEARLSELCAAWEVPFRSEMLSWPAGKRDSDGVWAPHWYASVERSTEFQPPPEPVAPDALPDDLRRVYDQCLPIYDELATYQLGRA